MKRKGLFICCLAAVILFVLFRDKIQFGTEQGQMSERALALMVPSIVMPEDRPTATPKPKTTARPTSKPKATATPKPTTAPKKDTSESVATPTVAPTAMPVVEDSITELELKATPYVLALENQPGVQEGWGKMKSSITASLTLRSLPQQGAGSVKRVDSTKNASVIISSDMPLKLYGLYEGEQEKIYRHVGVTYFGTEYYGYVFADRIEECAEEDVVFPTSTPTVLPMPTSTPVQGPVIRPIPSYPSSSEPTATPIPFVPPMPTMALVPTATPSPIATARPLATSTPIPTEEARPTIAPVPTETARPTVAPVPTATPGSVPTATPEPTATARPLATLTPSPTGTVCPTAAPVPTITPSPCPSPVPTATPIPTIVPTQEPVYELVSEGYYDRYVIPDRYNTGCYNTAILQKVNSACVVDGVEYSMGDNGKRIVIDLYYSNTNKKFEDEVVVRNKDFSDMIFSVYQSAMRESQVNIVFENCVFDQIFLDYTQDMVDFYFVNCSIRYFSGSEATFDKCFFGGSCYDGMNPLRNVTVRESYFAGYPQSNNMGKHSDAIHVFGKTGIDAENIVLWNCRMEMPMIKGRKGSTGYINACMAVALEYSNARNFLFEDCILNGGGYTLYALDSDGKWELENIAFRNISFGSGHLYGDIYPKVADGVILENLHDTEKLYVASVWKDSAGRIHLSVSNDTAEDKTLLIITENGKQEIMIPSKATSEAAGAMEYYDLAIDMEIVPEDALSNWVVCYDGEETAENQIRYVNWSGEVVYRYLN